MKGATDRGSSKRTGGQPSAERADGSLSMRVVVKYALVQIPAIVVLALGLLFLEQWVDLPGWLFWVIVLGWIAKDLVLFPLTWRAYLPSHATHPLVGMQGVVQERLAPEGFVQVRGELWHARVTSEDSVAEPGEFVRVLEVRGMELMVTPEETLDPSNSSE